MILKIYTSIVRLIETAVKGCNESTDRNVVLQNLKQIQLSSFSYLNLPNLLGNGHVHKF